MITEIKTCVVLKCTLCNLLNYLSTSSYNHKIYLISVQIDKTFMCVHLEVQEVARGERALFLSPIYQAQNPYFLILP